MYLKRAGLDLVETTRADFEERLKAPIEVDFSVEGLEEFARLGTRGVEPGDPGLSLLYHVFASPHVTPEGIADEDYPGIEDLEVLENYIYSAAAPTIESMLARAGDGGLAIGVFAYEYATAVDTVHGCHADLSFSRMGIGRVGTAGPNYVPKARGYFPHSAGNQVHVVPARYGVFLAAQRAGDKTTIGPMRFHRGDDRTKFWVPLHKLFDGTECIAGLNLTVSIEMKHRNEKIKKVHQALQAEGVDTGWNAAQMQLPPFVIVDELATFDRATGHVVPVEHDPMVAPARTDEGRLVGFPVPPGHQQLRGTLWFGQEVDGRPWPEFVHVKHAIVTDAAGKRDVAYLPETDARNITEVVAAGGYEAANFVDWTADGWLKASCPALAEKIPRQLPAYSVLSQPDFFPMVKQQDLMTWWEKTVPRSLKDRIWPDQGITPAPLAEARLPVNFTLAGAGFESNDRTMTAIVGMDRRPGPKGGIVAKQPRRESTLSYRATNLFQPGWDSTEDFHRDANAKMGTYHLANYGLGSPYAEDTLVCAAFGAFWPAAVPDTTRFFAPNSYPSTTPILDGQAGWDDVPLPVTTGGVTVYKTFAYADYVRSIHLGTFRYEEFAEVTLEQYLDRTAATARVYEFLKVVEASDRRKHPILSFRHPDEAEMTLIEGQGWKAAQDRTFRVEVAEFVSFGAPSTTDPETTTVNLKDLQVLYVAERAIAYQDVHRAGGWRVRRF
jgi:hypothetical protein